MIQHLACIMDGNRRWAKQRGWKTLRGHKQGMESVKRVIDFCLKKNISYLSLYTFSLENFRRSAQEKSYLFNLIATQIAENTPTFIEQGIRVRFIGDRSLFPEHVLPACERIEQETEHLKNLNLNFLFCYGSRQEIIGGVKSLFAKIKSGVLRERDITDEYLARELWTSGMPEPDLVIRTGGYKRLSNFLLYQSAYSEFAFLDCLWPELTAEDLEGALQNFGACRRNFGT